MSDAPIKDYVDAQNAAILRVGLVAMIGILGAMFIMNSGSQKALKVAFDSAGKALDFHNDVIRKGERDAGRYITRGQVYSVLGTALVIVGLAIAYYR